MLSKGIAFAQMSGCSGDERVEAMADCLRKKTPQELLEQTNRLLATGKYGSATIFKPTTDGTFLTQDPRTLHVKSDISVPHKAKPTLISTTKDEGSLFLMMLWNRDLEGDKDITKSEYDFAIDGITNVWGNKDMRSLVDYAYRKQYLPDEHQKLRKMRDAAVEMWSDHLFVCPSEMWSQHMRDGTTYAFRFMHRTAGNPFPDWLGVIHGEELSYIFGLPLREGFASHLGGFTEAEVELAERVMGYYGELAHTGQLTNWQPYKSAPTMSTQMPGDYHYMELHANGTKLKRGLRYGHCQLLNELMPSMRELVSTCSSGPGAGGPGDQGDVDGWGMVGAGSIFANSPIMVFACMAAAVVRNI